MKKIRLLNFNTCIKWFLFLFLCPPVTISYANSQQQKPAIKYDRRNISAASVSIEKIEKFRDDSDFDYGREVTKPPETFLEKIWERIIRVLTWLFSGRGVAPYILYSIFIFLLIFFAVKLFNVNISGWFYKSRKNQDIDFNEITEDIEEMDLDSLIAEEIGKKNYRRATRLLYLKLLKLLNRSGLISWKLNKTNKEYLLELAGTQYSNSFKSLTFLYEYAWYGNFGIGEELFLKVNNEFGETFKQINSIKY